MQNKILKAFHIFGPHVSFKRRVIYALATVRLILAPVILLTIYYLFEMGTIVNRIVNIDAPATTLAEEISVDTLRARRSERDYFWLQDAAYLQTNHEALGNINRTLDKLDELEPKDQSLSQAIRKAAQQYGREFATAVSLLKKPGASTAQRVQQSVTAYEADLNSLLRHARRTSNSELVREVQDGVQSFDTELAKIVGQENPTLSLVTPGLKASSDQILQIAAQLKTQSWAQVQQDHQDARRLIHNAEWVLSIVSAITFVLSVWVSFVLPRQVVKPLLGLRQAVDEAVSGRASIGLDLQGKDEIADLARSIERLINRLQN